MKIQRFNEKYSYTTNDEEYGKPKGMSKKVYDYITDFAANADYNVIEWVSNNSKSTKLKEYTNITKSEKDALIFSESKNLQKLKELLNINKHINDLNKEYKKIIKNRDIIFTEASDEVMYKYQEELINNDFNKFFEFFIEDLYDDYIEGYSDYEYVYYDIHPKIMEEYGENIINHVDALIKAKKYNL